jgi:beta-phosphoglucomutase-like phosphatase (HAD superfamily)
VVNAALSIVVNQGFDRKRLKAPLFDLDGTLLDSFSVHLEAYRIMFARFGIEITKERFLSSYSPNWYETYQGIGLPKETWETANSYWLEAAAQQTPGLFPGVERILKAIDSCIQLKTIAEIVTLLVQKSARGVNVHEAFLKLVL